VVTVLHGNNETFVNDIFTSENSDYSSRISDGCACDELPDWDRERVSVKPAF
jgi:hypothetical protein